MKPDGVNVRSASRKDCFTLLLESTKGSYGQDGYAMSALRSSKKKTGGIMMEKQTNHEVCANCPLEPVKPKYVNQYHCYCGKCDKRIPLKHKPQFCMRCGQKVDWT